MRKTSQTTTVFFSKFKKARGYKYAFFCLIDGQFIFIHFFFQTLWKSRCHHTYIDHYFSILFEKKLHTAVWKSNLSFDSKS